MRALPHVPIYPRDAKKRRIAQQEDIRLGLRGIIAKWFKMKLVATRLPAHKLTTQEKKSLKEWVHQFKVAGGKIWNGRIVRVGYIRPLPDANGQVSNIHVPITVGRFYNHLGSQLGPRLRKRIIHLKKKGIRMTNPSREKYDRGAHTHETYDVGVSPILEVGQDSRGNPTHVLVIKRSSYVPVEPSLYDFPAGLAIPGEKLLDIIARRLSEETGISPSSIQTIGPGMIPTSEEIFFAIHRIDRMADYNFYVIQRTNDSVAKVRSNIEKKIREGKKKKDPNAPTGYRLIPRKYTAIQAFLRNHSTFMPEVLDLYSRELLKAQIR